MLGIVMTGLSTFLLDVALALVTLIGTATLLWGWFFWLAGKAEWVSRADDAPRTPGPSSIGSRIRSERECGPRSLSPVARAEIAELEKLWKLPHGGRSDPPQAGGLEE